MSQGYPGLETSPRAPGNLPMRAIEIIAMESGPFGIAPSGTLTAGGALTLGTALDNTYGPSNNNCPGIWLYFPATAFSTLPASYYWTVMSSTTLGTVYNIPYTAPGLFPTITQNQANIAGIAIGTGVGYTAPITNITSFSIQLPPNIMGSNGGFRITTACCNNGTAGNKTMRALIGNTVALASATVIGQIVQSTNILMRCIGTSFCKGNPQSQASSVGAGSGVGTSGASVAFTSYDFTQQNIYAGVGLQIATATDWLICHEFCVELIPG